MDALRFDDNVAHVHLYSPDGCVGLTAPINQRRDRRIRSLRSRVEASDLRL